MTKHMKWYPIQNGPAVPWSLMERHREQLKKNHDQTLEGLAERGGLSVYEALCAIEGRKLGYADGGLSSRSDAELRRQLEAHVAKDMTARMEAVEAERNRLHEHWHHIAGRNLERAEAAEIECERLRSQRDQLREQLAVAVQALRPFAEMAEGKDEWPATHNCAQFPTMPQVRAARDALDQINQDK